MEWDFDRLLQYLPPGVADFITGPKKAVEQQAQAVRQRQLIAYAVLAIVIYAAFFAKGAR